MKNTDFGCHISQLQKDQQAISHAEDAAQPFARKKSGRHIWRRKAALTDVCWLIRDYLTNEFV